MMKINFNGQHPLPNTNAHKATDANAQQKKAPNLARRVLGTIAGIGVAAAGAPTIHQQVTLLGSVPVDCWRELPSESQLKSSPGTPLSFKYPIEKLKIEKAFVEEMDKNPQLFDKYPVENEVNHLCKFPKNPFSNPAPKYPALSEGFGLPDSLYQKIEKR